MTVDRLEAPRRALSEAAQAHSDAPHDVGRLEMLCRQAVAYTRARDALSAKPSQLPTGHRSANDPGYALVPFGRDKGKYFDDVPDAGLRWLREAVQESVDNPDKERWRDKNTELLDAIVTVLERRGAA